MGFEEYLSSGNYCFIEWPGMIPNLWPNSFIEIKIMESEGGARKIIAQKHLHLNF
jgi:tRNA threonylcarbamoyladenosine biosynthesis protein TsaE